MRVFLVISEYYVEAVFTDLGIAGKYLEETIKNGKIAWMETHVIREA